MWFHSIFCAIVLFCLADAQRFRREDTCSQLSACLNEFERQNQQCQLNMESRQGQRMNRVRQIALNQCGIDINTLKMNKRSYQLKRKEFMSNCTQQLITPTVSPFAPQQMYCQTFRASATSSPRECRRAARKCRQECMDYKKGCIKAAICHEEYETGLRDPLHDQIHRINLQVLKAQDCLQNLFESGQFGRGGGFGNRRSKPSIMADFGGEVNLDLPGYEFEFDP